MVPKERAKLQHLAMKGVDPVWICFLACFEAPAMVTPELQGEVAQLLACNWELASQLESCWIFLVKFVPQSDGDVVD